MRSATDFSDAFPDEKDVAPSRYLGPPAHPDDLGTLGRYRVLKKLGAGGMGVVFLALDESLDRRVALKIMLPHYAAMPTAKDRFLREAKAAGKVKSDHVVTLHEVGEANGSPFIAMEYLQGQPLDEFLKANSNPSVSQILRIGREVAAGLADAHALGLVHRDIKPANLWLEAPKGRLKILDFGLARQQTGDVQLTQSGMVIGTPSFMSPEQAMGKPLDGRSDLFSLGGVLYRLCTGRLPFPGDNQMEVLTRLATEEPSPVRGLNPNIPEPLAKLVHKLLAKNAANRFSSAEEVVRAITKIQAMQLAEAAPARPRNSPPEVPVAEATSTHEIKAPLGQKKPTSRRRMSWALAAVLGIVVILMLAVAGEMYNRSRHKAEEKGDLAEFPTTVETSGPKPAKSGEPGLSVVDLLTSPDWKWSEPENLGPGVNSEEAEFSIALTDDELRLVFSSVRSRGWNLYEARRNNISEPFANPKLIQPLGGATFVSQPWISGNGLLLLCSRCRVGENHNDIWECRRPGLSAAWDKPVRLGANVNSGDDENSPALSPDGLTMYFSRGRVQTDNYDIWRCRRPSVDAEWEPAERLGLDINTDVPERCPRVLSDGKSLSFTRRGGPGEHLWLTATPAAGDRWTVKRIGAFPNGASHDPVFSKDGRTVWFSGTLPDGVGKQDLWLMRRVPVEK
ncbi:serine/threonine-protein kinase [Zavarzinella formosa]|uniref:serine/threonine-protein kinase n=1 Tax=Zavarzinella formosa TaxID=360055 RepID=UPI0003171CED|nr:serine/threonine-protein kinase [Zavarzinella formosa]